MTRGGAGQLRQLRPFHASSSRLQSPSNRRLRTRLAPPTYRECHTQRRDGGCVGKAAALPLATAAVTIHAALLSLPLPVPAFHAAPAVPALPAVRAPPIFPVAAGLLARWLAAAATAALLAARLVVTAPPAAAGALQPAALWAKIRNKKKTGLRAKCRFLTIR